LSTPQVAAGEGEMARPAAPLPRPAQDVARDADRKPQAVMDFFGIEPGMRVVELMAGRGYYAELLARRVGDEGNVWAHNTPFVLDRFAAGPIEERLRNPALHNVRPLETELEDPHLPRRVDAVLIILFFHDLYWQDVDRERMLRRLYRDLDADAILGIVDHQAAAGAGTRDVKTLHRVEASVVQAELEAAGFELVETSDLLAHPEDDHSRSAFDPEIRGKTDRFVHKYKKRPRPAEPPAQGTRG